MKQELLKVLKCLILIGLAETKRTLAPANLKKMLPLPYVMKVCTSVKRRLIASIIISLILKIRLRKWLLMARLRKMGINVVLTSWKSCVKSRGLNCLKL